jgi:hypothetical protein
MHDLDQPSSAHVDIATQPYTESPITDLTDLLHQLTSRCHDQTNGAVTLSMRPGRAHKVKSSQTTYLMSHDGGMQTNLERYVQNCVSHRELLSTSTICN